MKVEKHYGFDGPSGPTNLRDLFEGRRWLIVYNFPFDPAWEGDCGDCSHLAEGLAGAILGLPARDTAFAAVSRAPLANIESCRKRMGWTFPWLSSLGTDFDEDFGVTGDDAGVGPGLSVFRREGDDVVHVRSTYDRRVTVLLGRAPVTGLRHDRYPPRQALR